MTEMSFKLKALIIGLLMTTCVCAGALAWQAEGERARTEAAIAAALAEERARAASDSAREVAERIEALMIAERERALAEDEAIRRDVERWRMNRYVPHPDTDTANTWGGQPIPEREQQNSQPQTPP